MNKQSLRVSLDSFVANMKRFPTRREFRSIGSEKQMYKEFGGMSGLQIWYSNTATAPTASVKDNYLATLRSSVCRVRYNKNGVTVDKTLTLSATILKPYVGKGTSKKANDNVIFAYDVDDERFRVLEVLEIHSIVPIS